MLACVKESPATHSHLVYTVILHKLANLTSNKQSNNSCSSSQQSEDPEIRLALLQALPALAGDRSCVAQLLRLGK